MKYALALAVAALTVAALAGCSSPVATRSASPPATATSASTSSPSAEVIAQRMGLTKVLGYVAYTASTDPNHLMGRQNGYTSKVNWGPGGNTGTIEVFPDQASATARQDYVKGFTCPFGFGYLIRAGTADLRLGCDVTPAQAAIVEARFHAAYEGLFRR